VNKYPKLLLLLCSFVLAYIFYHGGLFDWLGHVLNGRGYLSMFLGGMLFSFGFTTPFGVGIFVAMASEVHPLIAAPIAGAGALLSDLLIFQLVQFSVFHDEIHSLRTTRALLWLESLLHHERVSDRLRSVLLWTFAGMVIASPLPDEFGVMLVSSMMKMKRADFSFLCFLCNTAGVFLILVAARAVA